jgi:hypothetical protein
MEELFDIENDKELLLDTIKYFLTSKNKFNFITDNDQANNVINSNSSVDDKLNVILKAFLEGMQNDEPKPNNTYEHALYEDYNRFKIQFDSLEERKKQLMEERSLRRDTRANRANRQPGPGGRKKRKSMKRKSMNRKSKK